MSVNARFNASPNNIACILLAFSFLLSAYMYALNAVLNKGVHPIAVAALVCSCLSWVMSGLADDSTSKFDWVTFWSYIVVLGILGLWGLGHLSEPKHIPLPSVRLLTTVLSILSIMNAIRQFLKMDKQDNASSTGAGSRTGKTTEAV